MQKKEDLLPKNGQSGTYDFIFQFGDDGKDGKKWRKKSKQTDIHTYIIGREVFGCLGYFESFKKNPEESPQGPTKISAYPSWECGKSCRAYRFSAWRKPDKRNISVYHIALRPFDWNLPVCSVHRHAKFANSKSRPCIHPSLKRNGIQSPVA